MTQYILDTDHLTLFQRNDPFVTQKVQTNFTKIKIKIVTAEEQLRGRFNLIRRNSQSRNYQQLIIAYQNLRQTIEFFSNLKLLDFTTDAYRIYAKLRQQKIRIGTQDLKIGSIALANNAILVTLSRLTILS